MDDEREHKMGGTFYAERENKGSSGSWEGKGEQELKRQSVCLSGLEYGIVAIIGRILPGHG